MANIKVRDNGPYLVTGEFTLTDAEGNEFKVEGGNVVLCRCGHSASKPFCDRSHRERFESTPRAST